ncbi:MAG: DUF1592 domain-containing protein [Verrucomicrobia bacterium]|nr:DUF1592 domain-containing protein [Verrucomicrobiota bacterium]
MAVKRGLSPKYLRSLMEMWQGTKPSLILDALRMQWRKCQMSEASSLVREIEAWQRALWRFTQIGHIGKRDGPKAWQLPVTPIAETREIRAKIPAPGPDGISRLYLAVSDAGDGSVDDVALWRDPRLVAPDRPDIPLRDVRSAVAFIEAERGKILAGTAKALNAALELHPTPEAAEISRLVRDHGLDASVFQAWLSCVGMGSGETRIDSHLTGKVESVQGYSFIKGWQGADALSVLANSSDQHVRVPGNMKPRSVAVHPSPKRRIITAWQAPRSVALLQVTGVVQHAHPECGNGVAWNLELRKGSARQSIASGFAQGGREVPFSLSHPVQTGKGDVIALIVSPRDGNHSCDLTLIDLELRSADKTWILSKDVSGNILASNPLPDSHGNAGVWHFFSEPDKAAGADSLFPRGSLLSRWQSEPDIESRRKIGGELERLLLQGPGNLPDDSPDRLLHQRLTSINGPLLGSLLTRVKDYRQMSGNSQWGADPNLFGKHPSKPSVAVPETSLCVKGPNLLEVKLPAGFAEGCELVTTASLHPEAGTEGSVQMTITSSSKPELQGLSPGGIKSSNAKGTWSDGVKPPLSEAPVLTQAGSRATKRMGAGFDEFRAIFPAALCYTKIVPVDEVVTLTLFYREDEPLQRLLLDDAQIKELNTLWEELSYVSQEPLKLVDAFEQLWQFATQDADPSAFEPMRQPIQSRAAAFRKSLGESEAYHLHWVNRLATQAFRRPVRSSEEASFKETYGKMRNEGLNHDAAIRLLIARVLTSPAFLYRSETPGPGAQPVPVNDWELASRLSYFLWSSQPDHRLRESAMAGRLRTAGGMTAEVRRMCEDPRIRRLAREFACAWLHLYDFSELREKSERHFPSFNALRSDMQEETIRFFMDLFVRDGSILEILNSDHTFLSPELAKHYNVPGVEGSGWRRVEGMRAHSRGGVLGQASFLSRQAGASRTSPILRGNWVAEVLLGEKLPRPPKDVPVLPEDESTETLSMRQLTEKHSSDPRCSGCHRRIDPYGFALEEFDAIGRHRAQDMGGRRIDVKATVLDGTPIEGMDGLRTYLSVTRRDAFVKQFCRKLLGYALGRGVVVSDQPLLTEIQTKLKSSGFRFSVALDAIVQSRQFTEIRGVQAADD